MPTRIWFKLLLAAASLTLLAALGGCGDDIGEPLVDVEGGDPEQGADLIEAYDCGSCHTIPGIDGADGRVGPPLNFWSERSYIAGNLPNDPESLITWIMDPQSVEEGTAMPDLGVTESQARNIAAYLYTLD